jgi:hypothetical protein
MFPRKDLCKIIKEYGVPIEFFEDTLNKIKKDLKQGKTSGYLCLAITSERGKTYEPTFRAHLKCMKWIIRELLDEDGPRCSTLEGYLVRHNHVLLEDVFKTDYYNFRNLRVQWIDSMLDVIDAQKKINKAYEMPVVGRLVAKYLKFKYKNLPVI